MAQYLRPINPDITVSGWTPTPLWAEIDEATPEDSDYIVSTKNPVSEICELTLSGVTDPEDHTGHIMRVRARDDKDTGDLDMQLYEGATMRAQRMDVFITSSFVTYELTLTEVEAAAINDYSALSLRVSARGVANNYVYVSWIELEVPDAGPAFIPRPSAQGLDPMSF